MSAQHTPGPWIYSPAVACVFAQEEKKHCPQICSFPAFAPENTANGTLIALAPELLDALYAALPCVEESEEFDKPHAPKLSVQIRALLAKAEGVK
jgi:hypothetical protein